MEAECYSLYNKSRTYHNAQIYGTVHYSVLYEFIYGAWMQLLHKASIFCIYIIKQNVSRNSRVRKMQSSFAGRLRRCSHASLLNQWKLKSLTYYNLQIYGTVDYSVLYMYKKGVYIYGAWIQLQHEASIFCIYYKAKC